MVETFEWRGGALVPSFPSRSLTEAAAALPEGGYTSLRTYHGNRILRLAQHALRLGESTEGGHLEEAELRRAVAAALMATRHPDSRLRLTFAPPRLFVSVEAFEPLPEELYRSGARCVFVPLRRGNPHRKDTRFIAQAATAYGSLPKGIHEGILCADDGRLLEGLSSNFFAVLKGEVRTEGREVLEGVTRGVVLDLAQKEFDVRLEAVVRDDVGQLEEAFLTSVSRGVLPVVEVGGQRIGEGRPGAATALLAAALEDCVEREAEPVF